MRNEFVVSTGSRLLEVNVIVSCSADHANVPLVAGVTEKADWTEFVSIGLLNCNTICAAGETFVALCAGN